MTHEEPSPGPRHRGFRTGRLEAFSDGVFAIAVTLLVLDITVAGDADKHLLHSVAELWPSYLGYIHNVSAERVAVTFYGISCLLTTTLLLVLWRYAVRARLVRPDLADEEIRLLTERLTPGLAAYLVLLVSGIFVPIVAVSGYLAIALYYIIPTRRLSARFLPQRRHTKDRG